MKVVYVVTKSTTTLELAMMELADLIQAKVEELQALDVKLLMHKVDTRRDGSFFACAIVQLTTEFPLLKVREI